MKPIRHNPDSWQARVYARSYRLRRHFLPRRKPKKVFICFSAGPGFDSQYIVRDVRRLNIFDEVKAYGAEDLGAAFWARHGAFVKAHEIGFGYWIWKPYIIQRELAALRDDDILVYRDAGAFVRPDRDARALMQKSFQRVQDAPNGICAPIVLPPWNRDKEWTWCKEDVFAALGVTQDKDKQRPQYSGGRFLCRKNPASMRIVNYWAALAWEQHYHLFDDSPSRLPNHKDFRQHRHDQAVFSMLMHRYGGAVWQEELGIFYKFRQLAQCAEFLLRGEDPPGWQKNPHQPSGGERALLRRWAALYRQEA